VATTAVLIVSIPGVQSFIAASRRTRDSWAASSITAEVAAAVATTISDSGARLVMPAELGDHATPNRIVAEVDRVDVRAIAEAAVEAGRSRWQQLVPGGRGKPDPLPIVWVAASGESYGERWKAAQSLLVERRRIRDFEPRIDGARTVRTKSDGSGAQKSETETCSLCGVRHGRAADEHFADEVLCDWCQAKRSFRSDDGEEHFPSTASIASSPYRTWVLNRWTSSSGGATIGGAAADLVGSVAALRAALPAKHRGRVGSLHRAAFPFLAEHHNDDGTQGFARIEGQWMIPESWSDTAVLVRSLGVDQADLSDDTVAPAIEQARAAGLMKARQLQSLVQDLGGPPLTPYYAVMVQDGDRIGRLLGGRSGTDLAPGFHEEASRSLVRASRQQLQRLESADLQGRVVYAGGDDVLAFLPLQSAFDAVMSSTEAFTTACASALSNPTASCGVVVAHVSSPLRDAIDAAQVAVREAKDAGAGSVCIVGRRRGGERSRATVGIAAELEALADVAAAFARGPSDGGFAAGTPSKVGRVIDDLRRTAGPSSGPIPPSVIIGEIQRVVRRSVGSEESMANLLGLASSDHAATLGRFELARFVGIELAQPDNSSSTIQEVA
jgi:CRISPR-associated protein Cmr2